MSLQHLDSPRPAPEPPESYLHELLDLLADIFFTFFGVITILAGWILAFWTTYYVWTVFHPVGGLCYGACVILTMWQYCAHRPLTIVVYDTGMWTLWIALWAVAATIIYLGVTCLLGQIHPYLGIIYLPVSICYTFRYMRRHGYIRP